MKPTMIVFLLALLTAQAELSVKVSPAQVTGQKAIVPMTFKNNFNTKIESARAAVFLLDEQGKTVGHQARWVIGGNAERPGLASGATNVFHFVVAADKPITTTNLTARVVFSRVILDGSKLADAGKDVKIEK